MTKKTVIHKHNFINRWINFFVALFFIGFIFLYLLYIKKQTVDIFFESQFLHLEFLKDLTNNRLTGSGFFTAYAEHIFPGYNIVLAANYYLFDIWGGFDGFVYAACLIATTLIAISGIYRPENEKLSFKLLIPFATIFLLLSPTNNPQWGMALAAAIGVAFFVLSVYFIATSFDNTSKKKSLFAYISIIISIVFFLGGYAIGAVGAIFLILIIRAFHSRSLDFYSLKILGAVLVALIVYVTLVNYYGVLLANKPTDATLDLKVIGKFFLLMIGSSLIGKAFFENAGIIWPYYFCGGILLFWIFHLYCEYIKNPTKQNIFIVAILTYSLTNVIAVSFFRFRNGLDGALGQWYNVHTHFIGVAVFYYLLSSVGEGRSKLNLIWKYLSLAIIFSLAVVGYYNDWKKSEHVHGWKDNFVAQAPVLLAFPDLIPNHDDSINTMLWNYKQAKYGIDFLYSKNLWIFKNKTPLIFGLTNDNWLEQKKSVMIICPVGSKEVSFHAWRPDDLPQSTILIRHGLEKKYLAINNNEVKINFSNDKPIVLLDGSDIKKSLPFTSTRDTRELVAIFSKISCAGSTQEFEKQH